MEKKVGKETYIYDNALVSNKKRTNLSTKSTLGTDYEVIKNSLIPTTVKKVLGEKIIKELREKRLIFRFGCSPDGQIENVFFMFPSNNYFLTPEEISELEKAFLSEKFPIIIHNKEIKELQFNQICLFWKL